MADENRLAPPSRNALFNAFGRLTDKGQEILAYVLSAPEKAGQNILSAGQRQAALMNEAFDPTGKTLIRNPQAANQAAMNLFEGPLSMAPIGVAESIPLTVQRLASEKKYYGYPDQTSKGMLVYMPPEQFLSLASQGGEDVIKRAKEMKTFNAEKFNENYLPYLTLDRAKNAVVSHEGRARAQRALMDSISEIPVVLEAKGPRWSSIEEMPSVISAQKSGKYNVLKDVRPINLLVE